MNIEDLQFVVLFIVFIVVVAGIFNSKVQGGKYGGGYNNTYLCGFSYCVYCVAKMGQ